MASSPQSLPKMNPQTPVASTSLPSRQLPPVQASPPKPFTSVAPLQQNQGLGVGIYTPNASFSNGHYEKSVNTPVHSTSQSPLPAPHLPSPKPTQTPFMAQGSPSNSQNGLEGSSPGYSPMKQPSPPRPTSVNGIDKTFMNRPVTLEPRTMAPITSPPVKKTGPMLPPLHQIIQTQAPNGQGTGFYPKQGQ
jgi:hypothetical protein